MIDKSVVREFYALDTRGRDVMMKPVKIIGQWAYGTYLVEFKDGYRRHTDYIERKQNDET